MQVTLVAWIQNMSRNATNVSYTLDDGTGQLDVRQWIDNSTDDGAKVDELAQKHPAQGGADAVSAPPQDALPVQQITDPQAFKASLRTSDEAAPVLPWSEYEQDPHADTPVAPELTGEAPRPRANI